MPSYALMPHLDLPPRPTLEPSQDEGGGARLILQVATRPIFTEPDFI